MSAERRMLEYIRDNAANSQWSMKYIKYLAESALASGEVERAAEAQLCGRLLIDGQTTCGRCTLPAHDGGPCRVGELDPDATIPAWRHRCPDCSALHTPGTGACSIKRCAACEARGAQKPPCEWGMHEYQDGYCLNCKWNRSEIEAMGTAENNLVRERMRAPNATQGTK